MAAFDGLGDAEVGQLHATFGRDEDVARLHVPVDQARLVRMVERGGHGPPDDQGLVHREAAGLIEQVAERPTRDQLHHHGGATVAVDGVVDAHDVGVVEPGRGHRLSPEALDHDGVVGQRRLQELDRDLTIEDRVGGHPHLAHAAVSQSPIEAVPLGEKRWLGGPGRRGSGGGHRVLTLVEPTCADPAYPRAASGADLDRARVGDHGSGFADQASVW